MGPWLGALAASGAGAVSLASASKTGACTWAPGNPLYNARMQCVPIGMSRLSWYRVLSSLAQGLIHQRPMQHHLMLGHAPASNGMLGEQQKWHFPRSEGTWFGCMIWAQDLIHRPKLTECRQRACQPGYCREELRKGRLFPDDQVCGWTGMHRMWHGVPHARVEDIMFADVDLRNMLGQPCSIIDDNDGRESWSTQHIPFSVPLKQPVCSDSLRRPALGHLLTG